MNGLQPFFEFVKYEIQLYGLNFMREIIIGFFVMIII